MLCIACEVCWTSSWRACARERTLAVALRLAALGAVGRVAGGALGANVLTFQVLVLVLGTICSCANMDNASIHDCQRASHWELVRKPIRTGALRRAGLAKGALRADCASCATLRRTLCGLADRFGKGRATHRPRTNRTLAIVALCGAFQGAVVTVQALCRQRMRSHRSVQKRCC